MESRHLTIPCARCGRAAAEVALLPGVPEGESRWRDKDRLERTDFIGEVIKFGPYAKLKQFFELLARADYAAAEAADPDFLGFYCGQCRKPYCQNCWRIGAPEFDEGFYDCTAGICPEGHEQIVDD